MKLCKEYKKNISDSFYTEMYVRSLSKLNRFDEAISLAKSASLEYDKNYFLGLIYLDKKWFNQAFFYFENAFNGNIPRKYKLVLKEIIRENIKIPEYWVLQKYVFKEYSNELHSWINLETVFGNYIDINILKVDSSKYYYVINKSMNYFYDKNFNDKKYSKGEIHYFTKEYIQENTFLNIFDLTEDKNKGDVRENKNNIFGTWYVADNIDGGWKTLILYIHILIGEFKITNKNKSNCLIRIEAICNSTDYDVLTDELEIYLNKLYQVEL